MNGALGFWKICCATVRLVGGLGPVVVLHRNHEDGLTAWACALKLHAAKSASVPKSRGSRIVYIFESPRSDFAGLPEFASCHALAIHLGPTTTTSNMNSNAVLLHDERRVKGCKDFVG